MCVKLSMMELMNKNYVTYVYHKLFVYVTITWVKFTKVRFYL